MNNKNCAEVVLNKYLSQAGVCSRRKAADEIVEGFVSINNKVVRNPAVRVEKGNVVRYKNKIVCSKEKSYFLLNKPKGFVTTCSDPQGRKTVMDLFKSSSIRKGLFPVGRLDVNTTGIILITNDGEFGQILSHPSFRIGKVYFVILNKPLLEEDFNKIKVGLYLDGKKVNVDSIVYSNVRNRTNITVSIHIGEKHIIKRIFRSLGYHISLLDRIEYGPFKKRSIPLGGIIRARSDLISKLLANKTF